MPCIGDDDDGGGGDDDDGDVSISVKSLPIKVIYILTPNL